MKNITQYPKSNIVIAKTEHYNVIFKYHDRNTIIVDNIITCEDFSLMFTINSTRIVNVVSSTSGTTNTNNYFVDLHNDICLFRNQTFVLHKASCCYVTEGNIGIGKINLNVRLELK